MRREAGDGRVLQYVILYEYQREIAIHGAVALAEGDTNLAMLREGMVGHACTINVARTNAIVLLT